MTDISEKKGNNIIMAIPAVGRKLPFRLWRYVLKELLLPLFCCLAAFAVLFMMMDVFNSLAELDLENIPASSFLAYFLCLLPRNMVQVIPIAILLSTCYMMVSMGKNNELTAMRSSGLSLAVCMVPLWIISFMLGILVFAISEGLAEKGVERANEIQIRWNSREYKRKRERTTIYSDEVGKREWFIRQLSVMGISRGIVLRQNNAEGRAEWILNSMTAEWSDAEGWKFSDGDIRILEYDDKGIAHVARTEKFETFVFACVETPQIINDRCKAYDQINLVSLLRILRNAKISEKQHRLLKVMFWQRLSFPLACMVSALFGMALSIAVGRSGVMKGFAYAVILVVMYYFVGQFFLVLGKSGLLSPFVGGALSNLLFTAGGMFMVWRRQ